MADKEAKRKKHQKKMTKIVSKAWALPNAEPFQSSHHASSSAVAYDLTAIGQHLDKGIYTFDRQGWEHFAKDLGGVYNRHIRKNGRHAKTAQKHLEDVKQWLAKVNPDLGKAASEYSPPVPEHSHKKRKLKATAGGPQKKKHEHTNGDRKQLTLVEREERGMESLVAYIQENGGDKNQVSSFRCKASKRSDGKYETHFLNSEGRRFRGMVDVGRFVGVVDALKKKKTKQMSVRDCENEKKRLKREIGKMHRAYQKATKALDDFQTTQKSSRYPVDDDILIREEADMGVKPVVTRTSCAAAHIPDIDGFPGIPDHCLPDVLMVWDFLGTFGRALSLNPIALDDFVAALTYRPQHSSGESSPPVYLAEAHLALLKLLLNDRSSDEWWWSTLETDEVASADAQLVSESQTAQQYDLPVIKVDMAALLCTVEDPLITTSWIQALDDVQNHNDKAKTKDALSAALGVVANPYVKAYLRKVQSNYKRPGFAKHAIVWLLNKVKEARPDLWGKNVSSEAVFKQRAKVAEEATVEMDKLDSSLEVLVLDDEESEEESDSSDDEDEEDDAQHADQINGDSEMDESSRPVTSSIPPKPPPSIVDLLLPPAKPTPASDIVSPFTWPFIAGAAASRILHRYKRRRNEVDDALRESGQKPPMSISERRNREALAPMRILSECAHGGSNPCEQCLNDLCSGGAYLDLGILERLCLLRILVEAAYDTNRVYEVVNDNFKSRMNALKALEHEERRAKREAREVAATAERAARAQLSLEAKDKFIEDKRQEILESNNETNEYTDDYLNDLTDEDIAAFDEETKAEFDALPGPGSFNKPEVNKMVARMQEEAAFSTHCLVVLTKEEIVKRDEEELQRMEEEMASSFDNADNEPIDRERTRAIERLRREIDNAKYLSATLPDARETAIETLQEAIEDGTIKVLRSAIRVAKQAKLSGQDEETDGIWALDLLRDAALELKTAESRKRVVDAQKDLVAKRNKCFIRTEPMGRDRYRNRIWHFDPDLNGRIWIDADYILGGNSKEERPGTGCIDLVRDPGSIAIGEDDREDDYSGNGETGSEDKAHLRFCRQEYHSSGLVSALPRHAWGAHVTEKSYRSLIKSLDRRGSREDELRTDLKATLEDSGLSATVEAQKKVDGAALKPDVQDDSLEDFLLSGDEDVLKEAVNKAEPSLNQRDLIGGITSAIGQRVRVREVLDPSKLPVLARYDMGTVLGWRMHSSVEPSQENTNQNSEDASAGDLCTVTRPVWRVLLDDAEEFTLEGDGLLEGICRAKRWASGDEEYREDDAAFLGYRNSSGRYCGRAADAGQAATPMALGRLMVKREQELYTRIKNRAFDNKWGGKSGARNAWVSTMREFCFDIDTVRNGLLNLEAAFLELTGDFPDDSFAESQFEMDKAKNILQSDSARCEIELESLEKQVRGLWNSRQSRSIFQEIVQSSKTTGMLALGFDLLCRNCWAYLNANKILEVKNEFTQPTSARRRMNAWQQANQSLYY